MKEKMLNHPKKFTLPLFIILISSVFGFMAKVVFGGQFNFAPSRGDEIWGYDPAKGTEEERIRENFNLHRARWWNYYNRGSWYLANKHYKAAEDDFREVIKKRLTDKRDCRTYGMHFRDCFAHRELGITLYYRANQEESDKISRLEESIKEIKESLKQAESSRAAFYLNLSKESLWKAKDEDFTAPVITVENAIRSGGNWAVVMPNPRTVQIDICVTDNQSGVGSININKEELLIEESAPEILKTVHIPIEDIPLWTVIRAKDLVDNNSPSFFVLVESDIKLPVFSGNIDPTQFIFDGLSTTRSSPQYKPDLSTIQGVKQRVDFNRLREYNLLMQINDQNKLTTWIDSSFTISSPYFPAFDSYNSTEGYHEYCLTDTKYELTRKPKYTPSGKGITATDYNIESYHNENTFPNINEILTFCHYYEKGVEANTLYASYQTALPHILLLASSSNQNPVTESDSVYSVIVLPLVPKKTPSQTLLGSQFPSFWDAVTTCKTPDGLYGVYNRFDCRKMKDLDRYGLKTDLKETRDIRKKVREIGRELEVEIGLCGFIREYKENKEYLEMEIYIEDNYGGDKFPVQDPNYNPVDIHGPKHDFGPYMKRLMEKLVEAIPRVHGEITKIGPKNEKNISINVGKEQGVFPNQKLHVFRRITDISVNRLAQATVVSPGKDQSEAQLETTLQGLEANELFIRSK